MKKVEDLSKEELIELLQSAHRKLNRAEQIIYKLRKQASKVRKLKRVLFDISYYYDKYDRPSDEESGKLQGKVELKDELLEILND